MRLHMKFQNKVLQQLLLQCDTQTGEKTTHHETPSEDSPQVLHLHGDVSISGVLDVPAGKEQHNVTDDGYEH